MISYVIRNNGTHTLFVGFQEQSLSEFKIDDLCLKCLYMAKVANITDKKEVSHVLVIFNLRKKEMNYNLLYIYIYYTRLP